MSRSPMTATHRKLSPRPALPVARAATDTAPIKAALNTLASGPTSTTKSPSPHKATPPAATLRNRRRRHNSNSAPRTRLQFAPETAVRWVMPTFFIASARLSSNALVSPVTIPGNRPPTSGPRKLHEARYCPRRYLAATSRTAPDEYCVGGDDAAKLPASCRPRSGGRNFPVARTTCPGTAAPQAPLPMTTNWARVRKSTPPVLTSCVQTGTAHRSAVPARPGSVNARGGLAISTTAATPFPP